MPRNVTPDDDATRLLNGICPYFTMFPLEFPVAALGRSRSRDRLVLDPFCGRGTTNFAARLSGLDSVGIDSSPVAVAIAAAKTVSCPPGVVVRVAREILDDGGNIAVPKGVFWRRAYRLATLRQICVLRNELIRDCSSPARVLLRAIILGVLHGPMGRHQQSYLSNQCPRTFGPKPRYAVRFWTKKKLRAPKVDVLEVIERRARHLLAHQSEVYHGDVRLGDSRSEDTLRGVKGVDWVITSPPYYGMRTYVPDQWLRNWFVGGPSQVEYRQLQLDHKSPETFARNLAKVWQNAADVSRRNARLVCRFGGIRDRSADPLEIARESFRDSGWRLQTARPAGSALDGRRQSKQFSAKQKAPRQEYDFYAVRA